ncbi:MAG: hypothetical protein AB1832_01095 [Pseudomonadota bacterium]
MHTQPTHHDPHAFTTIGQRFAAERRRLHLPYDLVARHCAVTPHAVAEWETDGGMTAEQLQACAGLGMDVVLIVVGPGNPARERTVARWSVIAALREQGRTLEEAFLIADGVGPAEA